MHDTYDKEWSVEWEDGTVWFLSWFREAGSFHADRWCDEATGPIIDTPGLDGLFEDLDTLEAAMAARSRRMSATSSTTTAGATR